MSGSIGSIPNTQNVSASIQQSQVSSHFQSNMANAIQSAVNPDTGRIDVSEACDKLQLLACSSSNSHEKMACSLAIDHLHYALGGSNQLQDHKMADMIAGNALASAFSGNVANPIQGAELGDSGAIQVSLNGNSGVSGAPFHSHMFGPQPINQVHNVGDRPNGLHQKDMSA